MDNFFYIKNKNNNIIFRKISIFLLLIFNFFIIFFFFKKINILLNKKYIFILEINNLNFIENSYINNILDLNIKYNFINLDILNIKKKIEKIYCIKKIIIKKKYPNTLYVNILEYNPLIRLNYSNLFIDKNLNIFSILKNIDNIPILISNYIDIKKINNFIKIENKLLSIKLNINYIKISKNNSWSIKTKNNIILKLGKKNIINRLNRFVTFYNLIINESKLLNKSIEYIDLRYKNGFSIKWI
ncbi:cell division protein FtsQ [endosymbiont of Sipalinus gigas]|uniref:cell division protein FtsQ/DivIB n=1 Tax=endosymbiont of Sipalinus gigas TaxID=1972134 RepID=UPI000DC6FBA2|nr:cell division protein FtsQ/DivIB [endosymbiont of Sipalinus gigas]BBA85180.1 cell division protein FtsQ [endosymbiont of Sipalinus gigas]